MATKKEKIILGKILTPNAGIRNWYVKELNDLVAKMDERTRKEVIAIFENVAKKGGSIESQQRMALNKLNEYYTSLFKEKAKTIANSMLNRQNRQVVHSLNDSISSFKGAEENLKQAKSTKLSGDVLKTFKANINENVSLIKSIQTQYFSKVEGAVFRAIINNDSRTEIIDTLRSYGVATKRRARNIARDQVHKAYESLSFARMKEAGLQYWEWIHGGGNKTDRYYHKLDVKKGGLNHSIHKLGEGAYDPTKGIEREILPGELPFCSCMMRPVIKFD